MRSTRSHAPRGGGRGRHADRVHGAGTDGRRTRHGGAGRVRGGPRGADRDGRHGPPTVEARVMWGARCRPTPPEAGDGKRISSSVGTICEHTFVHDDGPSEQRCCRCGELKPIDDFAWRRRTRGQRDTFCRPCRSAYGKEHYAANRQRYIDQAAAFKQRLRVKRTKLLIAFFETHPAPTAASAIPWSSSSTTSGTRPSRSARSYARRAGPTSRLRWRSARSSALTAIAAEPPGVGAPNG